MKCYHIKGVAKDLQDFRGETIISKGGIRKSCERTWHLNGTLNNRQNWEIWSGGGAGLEKGIRVESVAEQRHDGWMAGWSVGTSCSQGVSTGVVGKWGWKDTLEGLECQVTVGAGGTFESERMMQSSLCFPELIFYSGIIPPASSRGIRLQASSFLQSSQLPFKFYR